MPPRVKPPAPIDYEKTCFVIMPFGSKPVGRIKVNFDRIYDDIFEPAIKAVELPEGGRLRPARTDRDFHTGDITQEMFQYLQYSRFALADITGHNANVLYELGVRHSARESGTVILRQTSAAIPFDISHIKAFPYDYRPDKNKVEARKLIRNVLRASFAQNALDSPVQLALRAQKARKTDLEPLLLDAENAIRRFDRPGAIAKLREALRVSNGNCLVHQRLGLMLKDNGDVREAFGQFEAAVGVDPKYSEGWREKGIAESVLSREAKNWTGENGEASLRKALALNPDDYDGLASLGGVLRRQQRLDEALVAYERAVAVSSGHPYPLLVAMKLKARATGALAIDADRRRQLVRAQRMRQNQAELSPPIDSPWCFFDTAETCLYLGDPAGFLEWVRKGLEQSEKWQGKTFRSALQLLKDGRVPLEGLDAGLEALDSWIAKAS